MANSIVTLAGSTPITTGAYITLSASTAVACQNILWTDTTTKILKLAVGAAGSEVDICQLPVSSTLMLQLSMLVPAGSRLSVKAIDAATTTGNIVATLIQ